MENISAKEAQERTTYTIPVDKEGTINCVFRDIQREIGKGNYHLEYCRKNTDDWFFTNLFTSTVEDFFRHLGYHYTRSYSDWLDEDDDEDDCVTISW